MQNEESWDVLNDDDNDDVQQNAYAESLKDVILFAVDCSSSMIAPRKKESKKKGAALRQEDGELSEMNSHVFATLRAAAELEKRKALYGPNDMVGIILFNTMESERPDPQGQQLKPHITVLQPIQQVNADVIQNILSLLNDLNDGNITLEQKFRPWTRRVPLGDVFNACNWLLRDQAPKTATKRVFLVTDEDDPHEGSAQLDRISKQTLADLYSLGVAIEPFFISTSEKHFVVTKRYTDILSRTNTDDEDLVQPIPTVIEGFTKFLEEMSIREAPKRSMFHITMTMGEGFSVGVKGYGLVVEQKKITPKQFVDVDGELKEALSKTVYFAEGSLEEQTHGPVVYGMSLTSEQPELTGSSLYPEEESATQGGSQSQIASRAQNYYTAEDVKKFRTLGLEPGIRILGFKDVDSLAFEDNIKHSWFIYPNDSLYKGSIRAFNALLKSLIKKKKIGLALALFRRNSPPHFYAMIPQEEVVDDGVQERPPGFHMIPLPYADDIRAAPVEEALRAPDELVQSAAAWIKKLRIVKGYQPDAYPNPTLNLFYSQLEALALREEFNPDEFNDQSAPQTELMLDRAGHLVENWKKVLEQDPNSNVYMVKKGGVKRKADAGEAELQVQDAYASGLLNKMTVDTLKTFLRIKSLPVTGRKADLLQRATEWLEKN